MSEDLAHVLRGFRAGLTNSRLRAMGTPKVLALMFHGVVDDVPDYAAFAGSRTCMLRLVDFERTVRWCSRRYRILRLSELNEFLTSDSTETAVLLTFDDALASTVDLAAPVLQAHGVPATIFVTTGWTRAERTPAIFLLERDLWTRVPRRVRVQSGEQVFDRLLGSRRDVGKTMEALWSFLLLSDTAPLVLHPEQILLDGESWDMAGVTVSRDFWFPATMDELTRRVDEGVFEIGAHGVTHAPWTSLTTEELRNELMKSQADLEAVFQRPVRVCSYPHGLTDSRVAAETEQVFDMAFTTHRGVGPLSRRTAPMLLPRIHVPSERPFWAGGIVQHPLAAATLRRACSVLGRR